MFEHDVSEFLEGGVRTFFFFTPYRYGRNSNSRMHSYISKIYYLHPNHLIKRLCLSVCVCVCVSRLSVDALDVFRRRMMAHSNGICSAVIMKLVRRSGSAPLARKSGKPDFRGKII